MSRTGGNELHYFYGVLAFLVLVAITRPDLLEKVLTILIGPGTVGLWELLKRK